MMNDTEERDDHVMAVVAEALKKAGPDRESFLQRACQNDPDLYRDVSTVVSWEERMKGFLERPLIEFIDLEFVEEVFKAGQIVCGRFEILRRVGDGGMGIVYEAFDNKLEQRIAIKVAKPGFNRLLSPELKSAMKVRHRNICLVNEIHTTQTEFGDLDFLTMEFLDGETLSHKLEQGKLNHAEAMEIARQLCAGVAEAHRSGIFHSDLKPGNIILCQQKDGSTRVVITDFGLSSEGVGEILGGTPNYMAPELRHGGKASQASDVFSLGVILYEMVAGQKPFPKNAEDDRSVIPPTAPTKLVKSLPHRWDKAILACLCPDWEERCSAAEMLEVLEHKPFYRRPAPLVALVACLVAAVLGVPKLIDIVRPPHIRLALLPVEAPGDLAQRGRTILDDAGKRVKEIQVGKATASVIPVSKALEKGVATPQEAEKILGATYALQLQLRPEADGFAAQGAIINLSTMAHVRDYSGHFAEADLADLRTGLAGFASWTFHLHRKSFPETVNPAAAAIYKSGLEYLRSQPADFQHAMPQFRQAIFLDPHSPLPLAGMAEAYTRQYDSERDQKYLQTAQIWLAKAEAFNPDSPTVRRVSGLLYTFRGDYPKALEDYQRLEEIEPGNVEAWLGSGFAYEQQGMLEQAIADYRVAISVGPNYYKPYEYLGALYYNQGQYDKAEEQYKKEIEHAPERLLAYGDLAGVYTAESRYAEAEKVYETSLRLGETPLTLNNIGAMLAYQRRPKEAMGYYQRAIDKDPNWPIYWLNLGDAHRRLKELVSAKQSYKRGLAVAVRQVTASAANASARAFLAYLEARLGLRSQARAEITAALNSPGKNDEVMICAVETYEVLGDREQALAVAAMAKPQSRGQIDHRPDLAALQQDSRFRALITTTK